MRRPGAGRDPSSRRWCAYGSPWIPAFAEMATLRSFRLHRHLGAEPVENLLAGPVQNAGLAEHVTIQPLEIADAVRDARDIGMDADRHDATRHRTFLVQ